MPNAYTALIVHIVFGTHERVPQIDDASRPLLHRYVIGILRNIEVTPIAVNGVADHVHVLASIPTRHSVADVVRLIKTNSSKWSHEERRKLQWQRGYAAFSVSRDRTSAVARYVENQEEHHRKATFGEELTSFLEAHGIAYDPRYIFG